MKNNSIKSRAGFTLIEVIVITMILALLGAAALFNYITTFKTFSFLAAEKNIASSLRVARSYASTNKALNLDSGLLTPDRYGVVVDQQEVIFFADTGLNPMKFDRVGKVPEGQEDHIIVGKTFNFSDTDYRIRVLNSEKAALDRPVAIFYSKGSGEVNIFDDAYEDNVLVSKKLHKHVIIELIDPERNLLRYNVIFQLSGLSEQFTVLPE